MEDVLDEVVSSEDLKKFEQTYNDQLHKGTVNQMVHFQYAWSLVHSKYPIDIRKGIMLLEDLYVQSEARAKRDCIYYLAIGNTRLKNYLKALHYVREFLRIEPGNSQVQNLEVLIKKKMDKEAMKGIALTGGFIVGIASIVSLGIALSKK